MGKTITIKVSPTVLTLSPRLDAKMVEVVRKATRYRIDGFQFTDAFKRHTWDGWTYPFKKNQTAPSGTYRRIANILKKNGYKVKIKFLNDFGPCGKLEANIHSPREDQIRICKKLIKFRICSGDASIRSGKTFLMSLMSNRIGHYPVCIVSKSSTVVEQTIREVGRFLDKDVGYLHAGKFKPSDVWITSYDMLRTVYAAHFDPNVRKRRSKKIRDRNTKVFKLIKKTKVLLLDECQFSFSGITKEVLKTFTNIGYKIGFSGTPVPDSCTRKEFETVIGPLVSRVSMGELIEKGILAKPKILMYDLPESWYLKYLIEYKEAVVENIVNNTNRNRFIAYVVEELAKRNKTSYIMVSRIEHGKILRRMIRGSFFVHGQTKSDTREQVYKSLMNGKLKCIISTVGKFGLNLPNLDAVINAEGMRSKSQTKQKMRSLTAAAGKKFGLVIDFVDHGYILERHSEVRLDIYNNLKGFIVKVKPVPENVFTRRRSHG